MDPHRPLVHVSPPSGWLNDPNGFLRWDGRYHLFFQHNPNAPQWGPPEWAHLVSDDLVRWTGLPPALTPDMPPADPGGCWSGTAIVIDGRPVVHYTGVRDGEQATCRAHPLDDGLVRWRKDPANPIFRAPPDEPIAHEAFRDPFVWRTRDGYRMILGTSLDDHGEALLYGSGDGRAWTYLHRLVTAEDRATIDGSGRLWECPLMLPGAEVDSDRDLLLVGAWDLGSLGHVDAVVGRFEDERFRPERRVRFDHGDNCFYAPQAIPRGERWTLVGWLQEQRDSDALLQAGWAGALSLPREVWLEQGELRQTFADEVASLRDASVDVAAELHDDRLQALPIEGGTFELRLRIERRGADVVELDVRATPDGQERTRLRVDWREREVRIDKTATSKGPGASAADRFAAHQHVPYGDLGDTLDLHLHVDGSVLEMIVDERLALSTRVYPIRPDATRVVARSDGGSATLDGSAWTLTPVAPPTLPGAGAPRR